jgi:hypothetical protein
VLAVVFVSVSGCGSGRVVTSASPYIVSVEATSGSLVHSVQVNLKILTQQ